MLYIAVLQRVSVFDVLQGPNRFRAPFLAGVSANCFSEVPLRLCSGSRRESHSNSAVVVSQWKPIVHILNQAMDKGVWTQCHEEQTVLSGQSYLLMTLYLQVLFRSLRMCSEKAELLWNCHFSWKLNIVELASVNFSLKKKKKQKGFLIFGKSEFALEELEWRQGLRWGVQRPAADKALPSYTLSVNLWALLSEEAVVYVQCSCLCYCSRPGSSVWPSVVVFSMTAELDGLCSTPSQAHESLSNGRSLWSLSGGASVWIMN